MELVYFKSADESNSFTRSKSGGVGWQKIHGQKEKTETRKEDWLRRELSPGEHIGNCLRVQQKTFSHRGGESCISPVRGRSGRQVGPGENQAHMANGVPRYVFQELT